MAEFKEQFALLLKKRRMHDLGHAEVARAILAHNPIARVSGIQVTRWLSGEQYPHALSLGVLADFFGVTVDSLLGRSAIPETPDLGSLLSKHVVAKLRQSAAYRRKRRPYMPEPGRLLEFVTTAVILAEEHDESLRESFLVTGSLMAMVQSLMEFIPPNDTFSLRRHATGSLSWAKRIGKRRVQERLFALTRPLPDEPLPTFRLQVLASAPAAKKGTRK